MSEEATAAFGRLLRQHRPAAGLTQEASAERASVGVRSLQALERGDCGWGTRSRRRWRRANALLGYTVSVPCRGMLRQAGRHGGVATDVTMP
jgi:transcriptional regulator with XRE-family HTH domain